MARTQYFRPPQTWEPQFATNPGVVVNTVDQGDSAIFRLSGPYDLYVELDERTETSAVLTALEVRTTDGQALARVDDIRIPFNQATTGFGSLSFEEATTIGTNQDDVFSSPVPAEEADFLIFVFEGSLDGRGGYDVIDLRNTFVDTENEFENTYRAENAPEGGIRFIARDGSERVTLRNIEEIQLEDATFTPEQYLQQGGIGGTTRPGSGDDRIDLEGLQRPLDAGDGFDVAILGGPHSAYTVAQTSQGVAINGNGTSSEVANLERIKFSDGTLAFDSTSERVYRLYEAAFDREPDLPGLGHWIGRVDQGTNFLEVGRAFIDSDEFRSLYGASPSNEEFVDLLYQNVMDRDPDPGGATYWLDQIDQSITRAEALARFSDSEENRQTVRSEIDDGVFYV